MSNGNQQINIPVQPTAQHTGTVPISIPEETPGVSPLLPIDTIFSEPPPFNDTTDLFGEPIDSPFSPFEPSPISEEVPPPTIGTPGFEVELDPSVTLPPPPIPQPPIPQPPVIDYNIIEGDFTLPGDYPLLDALPFQLGFSIFVNGRLYDFYWNVAPNNNYQSYIITKIRKSLDPFHFGEHSYKCHIKFRHYPARRGLNRIIELICK